LLSAHGLIFGIAYDDYGINFRKYCGTSNHQTTAYPSEIKSTNFLGSTVGEMMLGNKIYRQKDRSGTDHLNPMNSKGFHWKQTFTGVVMEIADRKSFVALFDQGIVSIANFLTGLIIGRICRSVDEYPSRFYSDFLRHIESEYRGTYWNVLPKDLASWFEGAGVGRS
jgi:hypothetical protein